MRRVLNVLLLAAGGVLLGWMVRELGWDRVTEGMRDVGWGLGVAIALHLFGLVLDSYLLRAVTAPPPQPAVEISHYIQVSIAGHGINEAIPMKAGEVVKFNLLSERLGNDSSAAALLVQNLVMFSMNCVLLTVAPLAALIVFDVAPGWRAALVANAVAFALIGCAVVYLLYRGMGPWPLRVLAKLGVGKPRIERWTTFWHRVESCWKQARADRASMRVAWLCGLVSRLADVAEAYVILSLLGVDHALVLGAMSLASFQITVWLTPFIPMQTGSMEGGAYLLFSALGVAPLIGVTLELVRRIRRLFFIGLGVVVLGFRALRKRRVTPARPNSS